jgi:transposase
LAEGLSKAAITRELGISERTIRRWVAAGELDRDLGEPPACGPRADRPTKLDPYRDLIAARIEAWPKLSARRIVEEIRSLGYEGGYSQLCELVKTLRPREPEAPSVRFETAPGHQAQVDFAEFRFPWGRRHALLVVLGFSRLLHVRFSERQDMRSLFARLEAAFGVFGGVPL